MTSEKPGYQAYVLRIWQVGDSQQANWRLSLLDVQTGHRWGFTRLDDLSHFLETHLSEFYSAEESNPLPPMRSCNR